MEKFVVIVSKGIVSGLAVQTPYCYGPMTQAQVDKFIVKCKSKGYEVWDIHLLNKPQSLDKDDFT
jgi:hypothetical protein